MCSERIQLPLHRERTYGKNRRTTVKNLSEIEVAELLGLSRETVSRWWTAYVDHGLEALPGDRTGRPVGCGHTLNDGRAARLRTILDEKSPRRWGSPPRCGPAGPSPS